MRFAIIVLPAALLAISCTPQSAKKETTAEPAAPTATATVAGAGTVTAVDAVAGTVTINHEPIAAVGWPAMTMQFTAENAAILQGISVGDRVTFEIKSPSEPSIVTAVRKQ